MDKFFGSFPLSLYPFAPRTINEVANNKEYSPILKIVAFSWAMVGPLTLKFFADYGATGHARGNEQPSVRHANVRTLQR